MWQLIKILKTQWKSLKALRKQWRLLKIWKKIVRSNKYSISWLAFQQPQIFERFEMIIFWTWWINLVFNLVSHLIFLNWIKLEKVIFILKSSWNLQKSNLILLNHFKLNWVKKNYFYNFSCPKNCCNFNHFDLNWVRKINSSNIWGFSTNC